MNREQFERTFGLVYSPKLTIREACLQASSALESAGVPEPRSHAELLLMHLLGMERSALLRDYYDPMPEARWAAWLELLSRKASGEPLQYITGEQGFYGLDFHVQPGVLIPRPETELLVEAVLEAAERLWPVQQRTEDACADAGTAKQATGDVRADDVPGQQATGDACADDATAKQSTTADEACPPQPPAQAAHPLTVLDIGTGSGAIAVTLAVQRPAWRICASDLSEDALAVARVNADRHLVADRVAFTQGDLLGPFAQARPGDVGSGPGAMSGVRADILVSNPPYIPAGDLAHLEREVRDYEPRLALDGGEDGLEPYRRILAQIPALAAPPRIVAFEVGIHQAREVADMLRRYGFWQEVEIVRDYAGIERHVIAIAVEH
ncbi:peptide chain release factor N(5)-glutamine methyltransferase [Paenibacillaceae bacterium]|nr:peptide chain release factor N(5)-glutamine methyltransferase [Paenibacillaceae bacterium]